MQKAWFGLAVVALLIVAWMAQYQIQPVPLMSDHVLILDRWTGHVMNCGPSGCALTVR